MPVSKIDVDPALHLIARAMVLRIVLHESSGDSSECARLLASLPLLWANTGLGVGEDLLRLLACFREGERVIGWLKRDTAKLAVDPGADHE